MACVCYVCVCVCQCAAFEGHRDVAQLLLERGADLHARTSKGRSAMYYAARNGHHAAVQLLLAHAAASSNNSSANNNNQQQRRPSHPSNRPSSAAHRPSAAGCLSNKQQQQAPPTHRRASSSSSMLGNLGFSLMTNTTPQQQQPVLPLAPSPRAMGSPAAAAALSDKRSALHCASRKGHLKVRYLSRTRLPACIHPSWCWEARWC